VAEPLPCSSHSSACTDQSLASRWHPGVRSSSSPISLALADLATSAIFLDLESSPHNTGGGLNAILGLGLGRWRTRRVEGAGIMVGSAWYSEDRRKARGQRYIFSTPPGRSALELAHEFRAAFECRLASHPDDHHHHQVCHTTVHGIDGFPWNVAPRSQSRSPNLG
jgi:hypothetical protein